MQGTAGDPLSQNMLNGGFGSGVPPASAPAFGSTQPGKSGLLFLKSCSASSDPQALQ